MDNRVVVLLAMAGGLFAVLTFIHFFVDWVFQSHSEAMVKHNNPKVRAKHCLIYTLGFVPFMWAVGFLIRHNVWAIQRRSHQLRRCSW